MDFDRLRIPADRLGLAESEPIGDALIGRWLFESSNAIGCRRCRSSIEGHEREGTLKEAAKKNKFHFVFHGPPSVPFYYFFFPNFISGCGCGPHLRFFFRHAADNSPGKEIIVKPKKKNQRKKIVCLSALAGPLDGFFFCVFHFFCVFRFFIFCSFFLRAALAVDWRRSHRIGGRNEASTKKGPIKANQWKNSVKLGREQKTKKHLEKSSVGRTR